VECPGEKAVSDIKATQSVYGPAIVALTLRVRTVDCACDRARRSADRTFAIADAPKLPFADCERIDCRCTYERVANRRKGERRTGPDRRDGIRFEMKSGRRSGKDRRKANGGWNSPSTV
jgi:hypothetical protein